LNKKEDKKPEDDFLMRTMRKKRGGKGF